MADSTRILAIESAQQAMMDLASEHSESEKLSNFLADLVLIMQALKSVKNERTAIGFFSLATLLFKEPKVGIELLDKCENTLLEVAIKSLGTDYE